MRYNIIIGNPPIFSESINCSRLSHALHPPPPPLHPKKTKHTHKKRGKENKEKMKKTLQKAGVFKPQKIEVHS